MKCIIGLGNPGLRYKHTRHNVGFEVVKELAKRHRIKLKKKRFHCLAAEGLIARRKVILALPVEYMNLSGLAADELIKSSKSKLSIRDILVVCDDVNLRIGSLRMRASGGSGGHKGVKSIIEKLDSQDFARLRVGVGAEETRKNLTNFVLGTFLKKEKPIIKETIEEAADACECWLKLGIEQSMNKFNKRGQ